MPRRTTGAADYRKVSLDDFSDDDDDSDPEGNAMPPGTRQEQLFAEQDKGLEMLGQSAERLGNLSMAIHDELGQQVGRVDREMFACG